MLTDTSPDVSDATVGEVAYRRIRSDIVLGRLTPGRRLPLERLKETYGASISTLRELLNRLATEGLLVAEGSRGFQVSAVSSTDLRDVAAMRKLLECHGLKESFERGDLEWEGRVVAAHHKLATMEKRLAANQPSPPETWRQYDWAFHFALISACGSELLLQTYASICDKYLRYQMIAATFRGKAAAAEHRVLLDSALTRDWRRAQQTLTTHVDDCVVQMAPVLDDAEPTNLRKA